MEFAVTPGALAAEEDEDPPELPHAVMARAVAAVRATIALYLVERVIPSPPH
jgi:hypothetical protein